MPILGLRLSGLQAKNIAAQMAKEAGSISAASRLSQGELFNIPRRTFSDLVNPLKPLPSARTIQRLTSQLEKGYFPTNQQRFERTVQHTSYFSEYSQLDDIMVPPDSDAFRIISMSGEDTQNEYFWGSSTWIETTAATPAQYAELAGIEPSQIRRVIFNVSERRTP